MSMNQVASDLYQAISESDERKVKPYDTKAEVLRTEGNIVWVKIPGGVDETPVQRTNNANDGDQVMVRISGGRAWLLGNETSQLRIIQLLTQQLSLRKVPAIWLRLLLIQL